MRGRRCSAPRGRPSASRATTTRSCAWRAWRRASATSTASSSTARRPGRRRTTSSRRRSSAPTRRRTSCRSPSPRAAWPRPASRRTRSTKDEDDRGREHDALRTLALRMKDSEPEEWPDLVLMLGDQVYADETSPETREFIRSNRDTSEPPGRDRADLRGVHAPLPRVVGRAGDPLAAVHGVERDDLRRPRRARRLEHVGGVAGGDPRHRLVGRAHRGRADVVLDLPARGQPEPRRAGRGRAARQGERAGRRRRPAARVRARGRPRARREPLELPPRPRPHAPGDDRLARRARARRGQPLDARRRGVGLGRGARVRRLRPPADRDLAAVAAVTGDAPPRGVERARLRRRLGLARRRAGREGAPGARPRALGRVQRVVRAARRDPARRWAPASAARRPPASSRCRATSTTPTSATWPTRATPGVRSAVYQAVCSPLRNPLDAKERSVINFMVTRPALALDPRAVAGRGRARPVRALAHVRRRPVVRQPGRARCTSAAAS